MARDALSKIDKPNHSKLHDDFFIVDEEEGKRSEGYDEAVALKLKQDYVILQ